MKNIIHKIELWFFKKDFVFYKEFSDFRGIRFGIVLSEFGLGIRSWSDVFNGVVFIEVNLLWLVFEVWFERSRNELISEYWGKKNEE